MTTALRNGAFRRLAALYALDFVLEWFSTVALMVLVYDATDSPLVATAMLLSKQIAPALIVPPIEGALDAIRPRLVMVSTLMAQSGVVGLFAALGFGWWIFPMAAAAGTLGVLFRAALRGSVARTLQGPALRGGNAVINVLVAVGAALGPALAAGAVAGVGTAGALRIGAIGVGLLALLALSLPDACGVRAQDDAIDKSSEAAPRARSALGFGLLLGLAGIVLCVCAMDEPALLAYSEDSLSAGVAGYGAIYTAWGIGAAIGSLVFARVLDRSMLSIAGVSSVLVGLAYLGMGLSGSIALTCALAVVGGAGNGVAFVATVTAIQEAAPRGDELRAAARLETVTTAAPGIGIVLGGLLTEFAGPRYTLALPGLVCIVVILFAATIVRLRGARRPYVSAALLSPPMPGGSA